MRKKFGRTSVFAALIVGFAGAPLLADAADSPAEVVKMRLEGLRQLGAAFKNVNDELKSSAPNAYLLELFARQIRDAAKEQYNWFPAGSGPQPGIKTGAKPEIWEKPADFKAAQDAFAAQAASFMEVVSSKDVEKIRAQTKPLSQSCGGCHRTFRTEEKH